MNFYDLVVLTSGTSGLDMQWVTDFLSVFTSFVGTVFNTFPLNLLLIGCLGGAALGVFGKGKRILH